MAVASEVAIERPSSPEWLRKYPPLLALLAALAIVVAVLPSSLNLPQSNPTEVREFAPVPPEDTDDPPPPDGNLSSLGLASSSGVEGDGPGGDGDGPGLPPPVEEGVGESPTTYRCVGNPPRQTEDPLSPPCVPFFDGDNFGETYLGVTGEEVRILVYIDGGINDLGTSRGRELRPTDTYVDLVNDPPEEDESVWVRVARGWQKYFNERYQTYGRFVRFIVYFNPGGAGSRTPEGRRADAADNYDEVKPFATISLAAFDGGGQAYLDSMAKRGVLNFGSFLGQEADFFRQYPKLIWGYLPSLEIQGQTYANYVCQKVQGLPVDNSGNTGSLGNGNPRKFGLLYTSDPGFDSLRNLKDYITGKLRECGVEIAVERTYPRNGYAVDTTTTPRYATENMLAFQQAGVTTILWPGGFEVKQSEAARNVGYFPEWITLGDGTMDDQWNAQAQDQAVWDFATTVSPQTWNPPTEERVCYQAYRSIDPQVPRQDAGAYACSMYNDLRQLFIGIQVAGPRLGPTSVDEGFHAIPAIASQDLRVPACYYLPGDYTCIKDYVIGTWDSEATDNNSNTPGCYRMAGNRRYLLDETPEGNSQAQATPDDLCIGYSGGRQIIIGGPDPNT